LRDRRGRSKLRRVSRSPSRRSRGIALAILPGACLVAALAFPHASSPCEAGAQSVARTTRGGPRLRIVRRVRTGIQPKSVEVSPDGRRVWVANFGRPDSENVVVYDAETLEHVGTVEFEGNAVEVAFSPDGRFAYVSNFRQHAIHEVDAQTLRVLRTLVVGGHPKVITVAPGGRRLYVANWATEQVTEIDASSFTIRRRLHTGEHPRGMAIGQDGQRVYVAAMYSHLLHVFDRGASHERTSFRPCDFPRHLELSPDETRLYVSCSCCRQVRWFDPRTYRMLGMAQTGENPRTIDLSADGRWLAVADFDDTTVTLIDTVELHHRVHEIEDANQIVGVAIRSGEHPRIFATSWLTGEMIVLDPVTE
jgi:DNA-binding beta-propeller fold protein YncE